MPFARRALVCAGLLLPLFGLFGSPRRGAGRCRRPAAVREACRRWARVLRLCFRFAPGLRVLPPAAFARTFTAAVCLPSVRLCLRVFRLSFVFSCLTFVSQTSFHLSLMPRRAPHFLFGKKMGEKNREGLRPFEPHSCALRLIFFSSALLAGLRGPLGRKPPAGRETLEKPRSKAQLFKRFCAKGYACALRPISPFLSLLAGLRGLLPQTAGWRGNV